MIARFFRHLLARHTGAMRDLKSGFQEIEHAIRACESRHGGEICFVVEPGLEAGQLVSGVTAHERALRVFANHRVWDTEQNNGVLIYLLLADRNVEIVADRGFNQVVTSEEWERVCHAIEELCAQGKYHQGVMRGIELVSELLKRSFPNRPLQLGSVPDRPEIVS